jgi:hypothetical protein
MNRFPDFGKELQRGFEVHENCYDCAEFYGPGHGVVGCNAWPAAKVFACADYLRLPDVGVNGQTGQEFPPSRMGDRKEPRVRSSMGAPARAQVQSEYEPVEQNPSENSRQTAPGVDPTRPTAIGASPRNPPTGRAPKQTRQQSPASKPGPDGRRLCGCGTPLRKRERCCAACRLQRRKDALERYQGLNRPSVAGGKA